MVLTDTIHVMLLTHPKFAQFTPKTIADAHATSEVLLCISEDSREGVDAITEKALANGGKEVREAQDFGFMYSRSFEDPDGHIWEPMWMDMDGRRRRRWRPRRPTPDKQSDMALLERFASPMEPEPKETRR